MCFGHCNFLNKQMINTENVEEELEEEIEEEEEVVFEDDIA